MEQERRLLTRQTRLNRANAEREMNLLHQLDVLSEENAYLKHDINKAPIVRRVEVPGDCPDAPVVDWAQFGRLFDEPATP